MMEDCFKHSSLTQNTNIMRTKTKYLLNVEGKKKFKANTLISLIFKVLAGKNEPKGKR
jgi:hypothetical protein